MSPLCVVTAEGRPFLVQTLQPDRGTRPPVLDSSHSHGGQWLTAAGACWWEQVPLDQGGLRGNTATFLFSFLSSSFTHYVKQKNLNSPTLLKTFCVYLHIFCCASFLCHFHRKLNDLTHMRIWRHSNQLLLFLLCNSNQLTWSACHIGNEWQHRAFLTLIMWKPFQSSIKPAKKPHDLTRPAIGDLHGPVGN